MTWYFIKLGAGCLAFVIAMYAIGYNRGLGRDRRREKRDWKAAQARLPRATRPETQKRIKRSSF